MANHRVLRALSRDPAANSKGVACSAVEVSRNGALFGMGEDKQSLMTKPTGGSAVAIFLIATGPALALHARITEWWADRKQALHSPKVEINPFPWNGITLACDHTDLESFKACNCDDNSKPQEPRRWPGRPPII